MSWIDQYFVGYLLFQSNGVTLPQRPTIDARNGLTATDDPVNNRTILDATGGGGGTITIREVSGPGSATAAPGDHFYVNVSAGDYTITPATFGAAENFYVKMLGPTGGHSLFVNPQSGGQIETIDGDGTLTSTPLNFTAAGQEATLETPDGTNFYF